MFKILIAEDDLPLQKMMCAFFHLNGYQPLPASDGNEALEILNHVLPDLAILDVMMPGKSGLEVAEEIRRDFPLLPILMVTARDTLDDKRAGFSSGADDYLTKPVDLDEMLLHVQALMRRARAMTSHRLQVGETVLDYDALTVSRGDTVLSLPKKEFYLLYKLLSSPRQIFTRQQLMDEIWGMDAMSDERTVDVHIKRLREKCDVFPDFTIETVRGLGYKAEKT